MTTDMHRHGTVENWPALDVDEWAATRDTLHMWTQIVGKIRLAQTPMNNHWWQVPLYVSARGLTTSAIPHSGRVFDMEFDFVDHRLTIRSSTGEQQQVALEPKSVATFYRETMDALARLDCAVSISHTPNEVEPAIPFAEDTDHASYNPDHARRFWGQIAAAHRVLGEFRSRFVGKASPVHFFWGSMDLAYTRFSGRSAPRHPGGAPHCGDWVMAEAYSHELASSGFWPGGSSEGSFYAYAYPEPSGYAEAPVRPHTAGYRGDLGEFILPYSDVRTSEDPQAVTLEFLQSAYDAAADNGHWDRSSLERHADHDQLVGHP